jgi:hypothetical protein
MSAVCAALASVLFFLLSCNLVSRVAPPNFVHKRLSPVLKTWLLLLTLGWSLSLPWWRYSLTPLVYALHLFLGLLLLWALSLENKRKWMLCFFILGIGTALRPTQLFAAPFVALAFLLDLRKKKGLSLKFLVLIPLAFILGRSTAFYLPLRSSLHPEIAFGDLTRFGPFFHHLFALKFSKYVGTISTTTVLSVAHQMAGHFWKDLTILGAGLVLWGFGVLWWKKEKIPVFLWVGLAWGLMEALFVFTIPFPTFESHQVILGWAYSGFLAVLPLVFAEQILRKGQYRIWTAAGTLVLAVFVLAQFSLIGHQLQRKGERGAQDYARDLLSIMEPNALYFPAEENEYFPVAGFQQSFQFRKDVELIEPGTSDEIAHGLIQKCLGQGRPLYVTRQWALPPGWFFEAHGPLFRVTKNPVLSTARIPSGVKSLAGWGNLSLFQVRIAPRSVKAGGILNVDYQWARKGKGPQDDTQAVVAIFADDQGNYWMKNGLFSFHDIHDPLSGSFSHLKPGLIYNEKRIIFVPSDLPPGHYRLMVGLQKRVARQEGHEAFDKEFYERNAFQNLDKFQGHGANGAVVQFSSVSQNNLNGFWPATQSGPPLINPGFVMAADVEVEKPDSP